MGKITAGPWSIGTRIVCVERPACNSNIRVGDTGTVVATIRSHQKECDKMIKIDKKKLIYLFIEQHMHCYKKINENLWKGGKR